MLVTVAAPPILVGNLTSDWLGVIPSGLFLAGGGVYVFNCCLKVRYLFCSWRNFLAFSSSPRSLRERVLSIPLCNRCMADRCVSVERFCYFRYLSNYWGIFPSNLIKSFLNPSYLKSTFVLSPGRLWWRGKWRKRNGAVWGSKRNRCLWRWAEQRWGTTS